METQDRFEKYRQPFMESFSKLLDMALEEEEKIPELSQPCAWIRKVIGPYYCETLEQGFCI